MHSISLLCSVWRGIYSVNGGFISTNTEVIVWRQTTSVLLSFISLIYFESNQAGKRETRFKRCIFVCLVRKTGVKIFNFLTKVATVQLAYIYQLKLSPLALQSVVTRHDGSGLACEHANFCRHLWNTARRHPWHNVKTVDNVFKLIFWPYLTHRPLKCTFIEGSYKTTQIYKGGKNYFWRSTVWV